MRPAFVFGVPGTPTSESGLARFTWLKMLTASKRTSMRLASDSAKFLNSEASVLQ
jgi:hypothetical protein